MGLDAYIYFEKIRPLEFDREFPSGFTLRESLPESSRTPLGATHELECPCRYYGVTYERGPWPDLCAALMLLHACRGVGRVWYGNDEWCDECPADEVLSISGHFMKTGNRPWR